MLIVIVSYNYDVKIPFAKNEKLKIILDRVNSHTELNAIWEVINVNAVKRLGMTDHGPVHFQIVANHALKLLGILHQEGIASSIEADYQLTYQDAEVVVFLASITHDLGMSIQRKNHEEMSLFLANRLLHEILADIYDTRLKTIIISETLHAIIAHRADGKPLTIESGIMRVADALDMAEGRSRIAFEAGSVDIHTVSALAIKSVKITQGTTKPIHITVTIDNSAGIFQIDSLCKEKIKGSGLENYISLSAINTGDNDRKILNDYTFS